MVRRNTIQRKLVLDTVNKLKNHATADEIYRDIVMAHPTISMGTVYRNLKQLSSDGEIRILQMPGGAERFDHLTVDHYHFRCMVCKRIFDIEMPYIRNLEKRVKDKHGFEFSNGHEIMFKGTCSECKKKAGKL